MREWKINWKLLFSNNGKRIGGGTEIKEVIAILIPPSRMGSFTGLSEQVSEDHARQLQEQGWFVVDDFLSEDMAVNLRSEAEQASAAGKLLAHRFQFGSGTFTKPQIYEADLHDESLHSVLPTYTELLFDESLCKRLDQLLPGLELEKGPKAKTVKLQRNCGEGGCFPCHYDNSGPPSRRSITCLVYLNPLWREGHGGELVLMPFLMPQVVIQPLMRRAVFFRSDLVLHSVRPASAERFCFTIWFDSASTNRSSDCNLTAKLLREEPEVVQVLQKTAVQRAVSRAVYAEEYEDSLAACMSRAAGHDEMLQAHQQHVRQQMEHPQLGPFILFLRSLKPAEVTTLDLQAPRA